MSAPFQAMQAQVNSTVMASLANAQARLYLGGPAFNVVYDAPGTAEAFDGQIDTIAPVCTAAAAHVGDLARGDEILIDAQTFAVEQAEPDGTGLVRLTLREVA